MNIIEKIGGESCFENKKDEKFHKFRKFPFICHKNNKTNKWVVYGT